MKIIEFQAENIKKLKVVVIKPKGHIVELTGKNGSGKTSVLDSILYDLAGTEDLPSKPIRSGADKGGIFIDLGDYKVVRKFTASGNVLIVEGKNGARFQKPQQLLDSLFGDLSFDPLAFTRMKPKEQAAELQRLSRLEIDPAAIDQANAEDYAARTVVNREAKQLQAQADAITFVAELPEKPIDVSKLIAQLEIAGTENTKIVELQGAITRRRDANAQRRNTITNNMGRVAELKAELEELEASIKLSSEVAAEEDKAIAAIKIPEPFDTSALRDNIADATATNSQIEKRTRKEELQAQLEAKEKEAEELTKRMKEREAEKEAAIAKADMPVEGLGFADGEVTYKGLPLNQASGAEQLRVSLAIAMAGSPEARIILIKDGSLLDPESMEIITKMAEARDYQIWIERVDTSGKVGIVMEDGEVIADNYAEEPAMVMSPATGPETVQRVRAQKDGTEKRTTVNRKAK